MGPVSQMAEKIGGIQRCEKERRKKNKVPRAEVKGKMFNHFE